MARFNTNSYWARTKRLMFGVLALWFLIGFVLPMFSATLNDTTFLGFPLGYFIVAKGAIILLTILTFWFAQRQDALDHNFGVSEDT